MMTYYAKNAEKLRKAARDRYSANREAMLERDRARYQALTPEQRREKNHASYERNKEKRRAEARARRATNPELFRKRDRERRVANPEKFRIAQRKRYAANPEAWAARRDRYNIRDLIRGAYRRAKSAGLEFNLTPENFPLPDPPICPVFGTPFVRGTPQAASIDRKDNTKGYTVLPMADNAWWISRRANVLKRDATLTELEELVRALSFAKI